MLTPDQGLFDGKGKSLFLVGPTPRSADVPSWRPNAIEMLEKLEFNGTVMAPEPFIGFERQVEWEYDSLNRCDIIVAWIPRNMQNMLALTTNVEFGFWLSRDPNRLLYGRPDNAPHTGYLDWMYNKFARRTPFNTLERLLSEAVLVIDA